MAVFTRTNDAAFANREVTHGLAGYVTFSALLAVRGNRERKFFSNQRFLSSHSGPLFFRETNSTSPPFYKIYSHECKIDR